MSTARLKKGIQARKTRQPVEIDFTQHQLEDGSFVSTQERVVKDVSHSGFMVSPHFSLTRRLPVRNDRGRAQVQAPAMQTPTEAQFFSETDPSKPDIAFLKNHFYREGRLTEEQCLFIIDKGTEILKKESNLLEVDAPVTGPFFPSTPPNTLAHHPWAQSVATFMANTCVAYAPWNATYSLPILLSTIS